MKELERLVLGTVQLGLPYGISNRTGQPSPEESLSILSRAFEVGLRTLDTATAYGSALGLIERYHTGSNNRFEVICKVSSPESYAIETLERICQRLDVNKLEVLMLHRAEDLQAGTLGHSLLREIKATFPRQRLGVSVYTVEEAIEAAKSPLVEVVQMPLNLLDNSLLRKSALRALKANGKEVHARSVFLQGLFLRDPSTLPLPFFEPLLPALRQLRDLSHQLFPGHPCPEIALALAYAIGETDVDRILVGVESVQQLEQILGSVAQAPAYLDREAIHRIPGVAPDLLDPRNWPPSP